MNATSARLPNPMVPEDLEVHTWVEAEVDLAMREEEVEDVVVLIVVVSEEGEVTEVDSVVAEVAETVEDSDQAKWIPGETTDKTDANGHTSCDACFYGYFFFSLFNFIHIKLYPMDSF